MPPLSGFSSRPAHFPHAAIRRGRNRVGKTINLPDCTSAPEVSGFNRASQSPSVASLTEVLKGRCDSSPRASAAPPWVAALKYYFFFPSGLRAGWRANRKEKEIRLGGFYPGRRPRQPCPGLVSCCPSGARLLVKTGFGSGTISIKERCRAKNTKEAMEKTNELWGSR